MLQSPYPPIKIAKNSGFYRVSKLLNSVPVENSEFFPPKVTIQAGTILHILCWICVNFRVKSMHIVGFAPLSIGICPWYKPGPDLLSFELSQWWRLNHFHSKEIIFIPRHHLALDQWGKHQPGWKLANCKNNHFVSSKKGLHLWNLLYQHLTVISEYL